ncbi:MAG: dihydropteroate synthase, partial [Solirubrobacterales bacterium]|nr:dihydropteroate synthase [Solirubrobacterales bacterium]
GGLFLRPEDAIAHGLELAAEGAQALDVGGESTRPGAEPVSVEEELRRVLPVIDGLAAAIDSMPTRPEISIDTSKAAVAEAAIDAGAALVNDVSAFRADPRMAGLVASRGVECCLMHMLGEPRTMQREGGPKYDDVVAEVKSFLEQRLRFAVSEGVPEERILLDPGIGFGKTERHNLELLRRLGELCELGRPILIGTSRKQFLGRIQARAAGRSEPAGVADRLAGTLASNVLAYERGASVFRVHDVAPVRDALAVAAATLGLR